MVSLFDDKSHQVSSSRPTGPREFRRNILWVEALPKLQHPRNSKELVLEPDHCEQLKVRLCQFW